MKILILDNYDSFVYNLVQYIEEATETDASTVIDVFRNDKIELDAVANYDLIVLSPGPGVPSEAGIMPALIERYAAEKVIFGVCLGHQAIGEAFGANIYNLDEVYHGIEHDMVRTVKDSVIFNGVPDNFKAGRYHSWSIDPATLPDCLEVTARTADDQSIMAVRHKKYKVFGVQFHPESIMTAEGRRMIGNLLGICKVKDTSNSTLRHAR
ncbi:aminodeoxychorismate/anthranilate synthase component II [Lewinellaceae bacterium SD302]|nr:aminodeoxychorismate/anthranilate synthase component II [Lewinellaceae bacterium SD302]